MRYWFIIFVAVPIICFERENAWLNRQIIHFHAKKRKLHACSVHTIFALNHKLHSNSCPVSCSFRVVQTSIPRKRRKFCNWATCSTSWIFSRCTVIVILALKTNSVYQTRGPSIVTIVVVAVVLAVVAACCWVWLYGFSFYILDPGFGLSCSGSHHAELMHIFFSTQLQNLHRAKSSGLSRHQALA